MSSRYDSASSGTSAALLYAYDIGAAEALTEQARRDLGALQVVRQHPAFAGMCAVLASDSNDDEQADFGRALHRLLTGEA